MWGARNRGNKFPVMLLINQEHRLEDWEEDQKEVLRLETFKIGVEFVEMESVECMLREFSIEEQKGLIRYWNSLDIM